MGKEVRGGGPAQRAGLTNHRGTPYDRPAAAQKKANAPHDAAAQAGNHHAEVDKEPALDGGGERRSSWGSWVATPFKALQVGRHSSPRVDAASLGLHLACVAYCVRVNIDVC